MYCVLDVQFFPRCILSQMTICTDILQHILFFFFFLFLYLFVVLSDTKCQNIMLRWIQIFITRMSVCKRWGFKTSKYYGWYAFLPSFQLTICFSINGFHSWNFHICNQLIIRITFLGRLYTSLLLWEIDIHLICYPDIPLLLSKPQLASQYLKSLTADAFTISSFYDTRSKQPDTPCYSILLDLSHLQCLSSEFLSVILFDITNWDLRYTISVHFQVT